MKTTSRGRPKGSRERWPAASLASALAEIRAKLDAFPLEDRAGKRARLQCALQGALDAAAASESSSAPMRRYFYAMSALVHHERHGGLTARQITRLSQLALAILRVERIPPESPRLSYLYADVHLVLSQILRRRGDHWAAAWSQQLARRLARRNEERGEGFQSFALAIRALRLGHADEACALYARAEELASDDRARVRARVARIRALRLAARIDESTRLAEESAALLLPYPHEQRELAWEACCRDPQSLGDLGPMLRFVKADARRNGPVFALEAFLWANAASTRRWAAKLPPASTLTRSKARAHKHLYRVITALEDCYDEALAYEIKLQLLGDALADLHKVVSVETELLALAATLRWLRRVHAHELAALTEKRYQLLCWTLSSGRSVDLCGVGVAAALERAS